MKLSNVVELYSYLSPQQSNSNHLDLSLFFDHHYYIDIELQLNIHDPVGSLLGNLLVLVHQLLPPFQHLLQCQSKKDPNNVEKYYLLRTSENIFID